MTGAGQMARLGISPALFYEIADIKTFFSMVIDLPHVISSSGRGKS